MVLISIISHFEQPCQKESRKNISEIGSFSENTKLLITFGDCVTVFEVNDLTNFKLKQVRMKTNEKLWNVLVYVLTTQTLCGNCDLNLLSNNKWCLKVRFFRWIYCRSRFYLYLFLVCFWCWNIKCWIISICFLLFCFYEI